MIEVYKYLHGLSPPIMNDMFLRRDTKYNLRNFRELLVEKATTVKYGTETITYKAPQLWQLLPREIKDAEATFFSVHRRQYH